MSTDIDSLFSAKESKWHFLKRLISRIDTLDALMWALAVGLIGICAFAAILELVKNND